MRREFSKATKVAVIKRSTVDGVVYCESCKAQAKRWQIDHVNPDGMGGEPTIENAELICEPCYSIKNPKDTRDIARAKRREARDLGVRNTARQPIRSAGFTKAAPKVHSSRHTPLPHRAMFRDAPTKGSQQ